MYTHTHTHTHTYICMCVCVWMTIYIYSPTTVGLSSLANEIIVLPLALICKALHI